MYIETYPSLLDPVDQILLIRVISIMYDEGLEATGCLIFNLYLNMKV